ncbi:MAG TPA: hypothetical protein VGJ86_22990 [Acidimicrobiales bacterium]
MSLDVAARPRSRTLGWIVRGGVVLGLVAMWGYVLYLAFGPGRQPPIDRLDDPAFASAAEERCADALAEVARLPFANTLDNGSERADVVNKANNILGAMLDDLDGMADLAPAGDQRNRADEWLTDWRTLLGDRREYASALRNDSNASLYISEKTNTGQHVTGWIDEFAKANRMPSCVTPGDV